MKKIITILCFPLLIIIVLLTGVGIMPSKWSLSNSEKNIMKDVNAYLKISRIAELMSNYTYEINNDVVSLNFLCDDRVYNFTYISCSINKYEINLGEDIAIMSGEKYISFLDGYESMKTTDENYLMSLVGSIAYLCYEVYGTAIQQDSIGEYGVLLARKIEKQKVINNIDGKTGDKSFHIAMIFACIITGITISFIELYLKKSRKEALNEIRCVEIQEEQIELKDVTDKQEVNNEKLEVNNEKLEVNNEKLEVNNEKLEEKNEDFNETEISNDNSLTNEKQQVENECYEKAAYCSRCGNKLKEDDLFCSRCGRAINNNK